MPRAVVLAESTVAAIVERVAVRVVELLTAKPARKRKAERQPLPEDLVVPTEIDRARARAIARRMGLVVRPEKKR